MFALTPWVTRLLVANVVMFALTGSSVGLYRALAFVPAFALSRPWTAVSYMFLHAGLTHLLFNMLGLVIFGPKLEERLGTKHFLGLYLLSGLGGAAFSFMFEPRAAVVGASAAVYGVLLGFAYYWPKVPIHIWGILPVPAWVLAIVLLSVSLYSGLSGAGGGTAHFAHLGGLAWGYVYLKMVDLERKRRKQAWWGEPTGPRLKPALLKGKEQLRRWSQIDVSGLHPINREEVEALLAKAEAEGAPALSQDEREFLDRMAPQ